LQTSRRLPRRSIPSSEGRRKTGKRATRPPEDQAAGRRSVGFAQLKRSRSIQPKFAVDRLQLGWLDQPGMRHQHRMQRTFQLLDPEGQKALQLRKFREQVVV